MYSVCHRSLDKYALWADAVLGCSHAQSNAEANNEPDAEAYRGPDTPANTCAHSGPHPGSDRAGWCVPQASGVQFLRSQANYRKRHFLSGKFVMKVPKREIPS